jgi:hypothetical protein
MSKLRFDITMALDGFVADPNQSQENPLGQGGTGLHDWAFALEAAQSLTARAVARRTPG